MYDKDIFEFNFSILMKVVEENLNVNYAVIDYKRPDFDYLWQLRHNTAVMSAFKNNAEIKDCVKLLVDAAGNAREWPEFLAEARKVSETYNVNWLKAEYDTARSRARAAREWKDIQSTKDIYPNLQYVTAKDERVRMSHRPLEGLIYPIDDQFWQTYFPPNGWRCRCKTRRTDKDVKRGQVLLQPDPGFDDNSGMNDDWWAVSSPYRMHATNSERRSIDNIIDEIVPTAQEERRRRKEAEGGA